MSFIIRRGMQKIHEDRLLLDSDTPHFTERFRLDFRMSVCPALRKFDQNLQTFKRSMNRSFHAHNKMLVPVLEEIIAIGEGYIFITLTKQLLDEVGCTVA